MVFFFAPPAKRCESLLFIIFVAVKWRMNHLAWILAIPALLSWGCENDIERINMLTDDTERPTVQGTNIKVIYSDSARVKVQILAPSYQQFPNAERPYMEFPDGMEVYFYNDSLKLESEITADWAIYYMEERLWHATGNVVARRFDDGDALYTEELYWNEEEQRIYSDTYTKVHNEDNVLYGSRGFRANQDFSNWELIGSSGTIIVEDEE
jgi:LPS export ABC transporter protein LptC